ncbi:histidine kinase dimerization/phospho-acceptor domain-containing protein, partial [Streptomyces sp. NPDC051940]|uniref:histidine kinase dimerization/phospho-acceptor domain-containing protein n=1 Tax=Streptomyces sp. NPDC051940 TaxID=3155675 RepID=UPI00343A033D
MRLSTRIALAVGIAVPLLVLAAGWVQIRLVPHDLHAQQDGHLRATATAVRDEARALLRAAARDRPAAERARERRLFGTALDIGILLTGPDGTVAEGGPRPASSARLPASAPAPRTVAAAGTDWRVLSVPLTGARPATSGTLWLFSADTASREQLAAVRRRVVSVALLAAPAAGLLAWAVASGAARPLRRLQRRAGGLDPRADRTRLTAEHTGVTEVDDLARTIQTVLSRYDEQAARTADALATARSFSAAASHELRTPLMSMRTNLDVLAAHPGLPEPDRGEVLADLHAEHERMLGLLVMLRLLAEGDLVDPAAFTPVELAELAESEARTLRARHPGVRLTVTATPVTVSGWEPGLPATLNTEGEQTEAIKQRKNGLYPGVTDELAENM